MDVTLGIDIGGTNTKLGFVNREGISLVSTRIETHAHNYQTFIEDLCIAIEQLKLEAGTQGNLLAIGVGAPNANYHSGMIEGAPNLHWGTKVPLAASIQEKFGLPVWLTNDANAAAIGEMKFGVAKGLKDFVIITLGTGLGSGFVVDGKLLYGHDGFAGELGHITLVPGGRLHTNGRQGGLETYVSATGIKRTVFELLAHRVEESPLRDLSFNQLTAKDISDAAEANDTIALCAFEVTGRLLAQALNDVIVCMDPEAIILFGGLANAGELLMKPVRYNLDRFLPKEYKGKVELLMSNLKGDNTAILGASALAWEGLERMQTA